MPSSQLEQVAWVLGNLPSFSTVVFWECEGISRSGVGIVDPGGYTVNLDGVVMPAAIKVDDSVVSRMTKGPFPGF